MEKRRLRQKPGRGERSAKCSCIDKIAKWCVLGVQGRKLIEFTRNAIKFETIVIGNCSEQREYDERILLDSLLVTDYRNDHFKIDEDGSNAKRFKPDYLFVSNQLIME